MERRNRSSLRRSITNMLPIIVFVTIIILILAFCIGSSFNDTEYIVTITDKEVKKTDDTDKYLIYAEDLNGNTYVFENTDEFLRFKFDSSDMYGQIKEGETYKLTVIGYRVPFMSMYQNIIEIEEVE